MQPRRSSSSSSVSSPPNFTKNNNLRSFNLSELLAMNELEDPESRRLINLSAISEEMLNANGSWASLSINTGTTSLFNNIAGPSTPFSPSPVCSPATVCRPSTSRRFFSVITSEQNEFSTPLEQITTRVVSNEQQRNEEPFNSEGEEENKILNSSSRLLDGVAAKKDPKTKGKSVRTYRKILLCEQYSTSTASTEPNNRRTSQVPLQIDSKQEDKFGYHRSTSIADSTVSTYGDSEYNESVGHAAGERYFRDFISGIRRRKVEVKLEDWKEAKSTKLIKNLRKKEASITAWKLKEIEKANAYLKETEINLEKKRVEAMKKMDEKIRSACKMADEKKAKERQSTAKKISKVSKLVDHAVAVGKLSWWKSLCNW